VNKTPLKQGTKPLRRSRIKPVSPKQEQKNLEWHALVAYLVKERAEWKCELCGGWNELQGHHIIFRRYNIHNAGNCLIACSKCHAHSRFPNGLVLSKREALKLVSELNKEAGIPDNLTGSSLPCLI